MFRLGDDQEESFIFMGSRIVVSGECSVEINRRFVSGREQQLTNIWKDKDVTKQTERRLGMLWDVQLQCMGMSRGR